MIINRNNTVQVSLNKDCLYKLLHSAKRNTFSLLQYPKNLYCMISLAYNYLYIT